MEIKINEQIAEMIMAAFQSWLIMQEKALDAQITILNRMGATMDKGTDLIIKALEVSIVHDGENHVDKREDRVIKRQQEKAEHEKRMAEIIKEPATV